MLLRRRAPPFFPFSSFDWVWSFHIHVMHKCLLTRWLTVFCSCQERSSESKNFKKKLSGIFSKLFYLIFMSKYLNHSQEWFETLPLKKIPKQLHYWIELSFEDEVCLSKITQMKVTDELENNPKVMHSLLLPINKGKSIRRNFTLRKYLDSLTLFYKGTDNPEIWRHTSTIFCFEFTVAFFFRFKMCYILTAT